MLGIALYSLATSYELDTKHFTSAIPNLSIILGGRNCYYWHFTGKESEDQRSQATVQRHTAETGVTPKPARFSGS